MFLTELLVPGSVERRFEPEALVVMLHGARRITVRPTAKLA